MFKPGNKVKCVNSSVSAFTKGKIYEVADPAYHGELLSLKLNNNLNADCWYDFNFELMKEEVMEFKKGDIVEAFGLEGVVIEIDHDDPTLPILVRYKDSEQINYFTNDGKFNSIHKLPSLKLIERPKQKKKVMMYPALVKNTCNYFVTETLFETDDEAKEIYGNKHVIKLLTDRGVEVEIETD